MAQTGFTPILIYGSSTASNVPLAANLTNSANGSELAINVADGKLFYKDSGGTVQVLATKGGVGSSSNTQILFNNSGLVAGSSGFTYDDTNRRVGLNIVPSAWASGQVGFQTSGGSFFSGSSAELYVGQNYYYSGVSGSKYINNGAASAYGQAAGVHGWYVASSGTAGAFVNGTGTFTQAMTLDNSGNLGIGTTTMSGKFNIATSGTMAQVSTVSVTANPASVDTEPVFQFNNATSISGLTFGSADARLLSFGVFTDNTMYMRANGLSLLANQANININASGGSGQIISLTNNVERMRITSAGLVGIGNTAPGAQLGVGGATDQAQLAGGLSGATSALYLGTPNNVGTGGQFNIQYVRSSGIVSFNRASLTAGTPTTTQIMSFDPSNSVGINGYTPTGSTATLNVVSLSSGGIAAGFSDNINSSLYIRPAAGGTIIGTDGGGALNFASNGNNVGNIAMRIDSSGNVLVGTTGSSINNSNSLVLQASAGVMLVNHLNGTGAGNGYAVFGYNGSVIGSITQVLTTGVAYNVTSDYRLKVNQKPLENSGSFIDSLNPKTWDWADGNGSSMGFIAHEFATVCPNYVVGEKDAIDEEEKPVYQSIDASNPEMMANIIAELQSLRKRVAELEGK